MPIFQAAITSSYDSIQEAILISDSSDYITNSQPTHALARFDGNSFYRIEITKPDSSTFIWTNQSGGDVTIPSPSLNVFNSAHVLLPADGSGSYVNKVYSVPSWSDEDPYNQSDNDTVFHVGYFWEAQSNGVVSEPSVGNTDWSIVSMSSLNAKYVAEETLEITKSAVGSGSFSTTFVDSEGVLGVSVSSNCGSIQITDNSNYLNDEAGHAQSDFSDYRLIVMTKPSGETYYFSSIDFEDIEENQIISPASSGNNDFFYLFDSEIDKDGVYEFKMCNYPTWNPLADYSNNKETIVFYNGELYRALTASSGVIPEGDLTGSWELYVLLDPEDEYTTRYCTCAKIAVLCIDTYDCYEKMVHSAYCLIDTDYCNDDLLCGNKVLLDTVKLRILIDSIDYAVNRQAWADVKKMFTHIYNICGCC